MLMKAKPLFIFCISRCRVQDKIFLVVQRKANSIYRKLKKCIWFGSEIRFVNIYFMTVSA